MGQTAKEYRAKRTQKQLSSMPRRVRRTSNDASRQARGQTVKYETGQPEPLPTRLAGRYMVAMPNGRARYVKGQS